MGKVKNITERMTPARAAWLAALSDGKPQKCFRRGKTGYYCRVIGWTTWVPSQAPLEYITPAGIAALAEHERTKE